MQFNQNISSITFVQIVEMADAMDGDVEVENNSLLLDILFKQIVQYTKYYKVLTIIKY